MIMGVNNFWLFLISFFLIFSPTLASCQCLEDQRSLLLQLKDSLEFNPKKSMKLVTWSSYEDCCKWNGVGCDTSGHVISLELDRESVSGGIENSTSLFKLQSLQKLNLAYNKFSDIQIPSGISNLRNLVYLNLSGGSFIRQIPIELSYLRKLVSLDLSDSIPRYQELKLENPNLKTLVQNLKNLEELYLDYVDISTHSSNWSQDLAQYLPKLRILSLINCGIEGPVDASLSELRSLSIIQLDGNDLNTTSPAFFANFSNLTTLSLSGCKLVGTFPAKIFQVRTLQKLDFSYNELLHGSLEQFHDNGSLRILGFSNLHNLHYIDLHRCNFSGPIPPAITNLTNLVHLDFSHNSFTGAIPLFHNSKNLSFVDISENELTGSLSPAHFGGLSKLEYLDAGSNSLTGNIPSSIFDLPSLKYLHLSKNQLSGKIAEFSNASTSLLERLNFSANRFNESVPKSLFELRSLQGLSLASNFFTGIIQLETILANFTSLDLSYNNISVNLCSRDSSSSFLPHIEVLKLVSCKLKMFPELVNHSHMTDLDISNNQINGEVPNWIWKVKGIYLNLNLSFNLFVGLQKPYNFPDNLMTLDLHSNHLQGDIPIPPSHTSYVDYSNNNFTNSIPPGIGNSLIGTIFFSLANNSLTGSIPESICNATDLQILDLSQNHLTGKIPTCVVEDLDSLEVLILAKNNITDSIPDTFPVSCGLQTLDLSWNSLGGKIPGSLINCTNLEVLIIANNKLEDTFPCNLKNSSSLRILVLRSNKLYGDVVCHGANNFWPELQIIDIASNSFNGVLTPTYFSGWRRMILDDDDNNKLAGDYLSVGTYHDNILILGGEYLTYRDTYYLDRVIVTIKGMEMELVKIMKIFTIIDFSNNKFTGSIPEIIGDLGSLYLLNLSHNAFAERIPSSIGKLKNLGSLDLSNNQLTGEIPETLASLTFLSLLNLSFNKLFGKIPTGRQLQTFTSASYEGNKGLCGSPLNTACIGDARPYPSFTNSKAEINWEYVLAATGYSVGLASFLSVLLLCKSWREKYNYYVDKLLCKTVKQKGGRSISEQEFRNQAMRRS